MTGFLSRRRYEVLAVGLAVLLSALHVAVDLEPSVGLRASDEVHESPWEVLVRTLQQLEGRATDVQFRLRGPLPPSPQVTVVEVDEKAAQKYGLWPWPRQVFAQGLTAIHQAGATAIGLDITFTDSVGGEAELAADLLRRFDEAAQGAKGQGLEAFREALATKAERSPDAELEAAFRAAGPTVVQGVFPYLDSNLKDFSPEKAKEHLELVEPWILRKLPIKGTDAFREIPVDGLVAWTQYAAQAPLPRFAQAGSRLGHVAMVPDVDGTIRRAALLAKLTGPKGLLPSMPLQTAAVQLGATIEPSFADGTLKAVRLVKAGGAAVTIPVQPTDGLTLIDHVGPGRVFQRVSLADVMAGTFDKSLLQGKAALVGITLTGSSGDQRVTPFRELEPGIFAHASMVSNVLSERFLTRPESLVFGEVAAMVVLALVLGVLVPRLRSFGLKLALMTGLMLVWLAFDQAMFSQGTLVGTVLPMGSIVLESFGLIFLGYLSVDREKLAMRSTFSKYLGEEVMEEAIKNPEKLNRGEKREMTVLFSDIRGFTTLSERMQPEKLAAFIKEYLSPMTNIVFDEKGTLDKYIGDAVMAFWNAPLDQGDHALRACRAAWSMLQKLEELKAKWRAENYPEFDIGVGINTGPMIVGNMGSDVRVDYTVMGDAVNLGSRLEGTNKEYETRIIFSEGTFAHVQGQVICRRLGAVRVKGKRKPVKIYELRGIGQPQGTEAQAIAAFEQGLDAYVDQQWDQAQAAFEQAATLWPDDAPSKSYLEEIVSLRANPPGPGWDGVYTATTK